MTTKFKVLKPAYLKFIGIIMYYRKNTIGDRGPIEIPAKEINKIENLELNKFIRQLINDRILENLEDNKDRKYSKNKKDLILFCNSVENIKEYIKDKHVPGAAGLMVEKIGDKYKMSRIEKELYHDFEKQDGSVLYYLYENANEMQPNDIIQEKCNLELSKIRTSCNNIRNKLGRKLKYTEKEVRQILPIYKTGGYVLYTDF